MKKIALTALLLSSSTAFATDTRRASLSGNVGMADDTDYQRYGANEAGNSVWLDSDGTTLSGAAGFDGNAVTFAAGELGDRADFGWYHADGDSGYRVTAGIASTEALKVGGGYGMGDMDFGATIDKNGDDTGIQATFRSRTLSDSDVTAYGLEVNKDVAGINAVGGYAMGWIWGGDASKAALTVGPGITVIQPDGGDLDLGVTLAGANLAGEVTIKDWLGIRGSVLTTFDLVDPMGDLEVASSVTSMFGASIHTDSVDIDLAVDPSFVTGGPHFLTGEGTGAAASFSARFDI